jgi:hypothetical protein
VSEVQAVLRQSSGSPQAVLRQPSGSHPAACRDAACTRRRLTRAATTPSKAGVFELACICICRLIYDSPNTYNNTEIHIQRLRNGTHKHRRSGSTSCHNCYTLRILTNHRTASRQCRQCHNHQTSRRRPPIQNYSRNSVNLSLQPTRRFQYQPQDRRLYIVVFLEGSSYWGRCCRQLHYRWSNPV